MEPGNGHIIIQTTVDREEKAIEFARGLVEKRLAACVTRLAGGESTYRWESEDLTVEKEHVLLIKTHRDKLPEIEAYFKESHPFQVPEVIVLAVDQVSLSYGEWMMGEIGLGR